MDHIVILKQKYYDSILSGVKKIESRWSVHKIVPFNKVEINDRLYLKISGHDVTARCVVKEVKFYELTSNIIEDIEEKYGRDIFMSHEDFLKVKDKKYCTLIWVDKVEKIKSIKVKKSNGAGWMITKF